MTSVKKITALQELTEILQGQLSTQAALLAAMENKNQALSDRVSDLEKEQQRAAEVEKAFAEVVVPNGRLFSPAPTGD